MRLRNLLNSSTLALAAGLCLNLCGTRAFSQTSVSSHYNFVTFDYPGATITYPLGLNIKQEIAGYYYDTTYQPHGFVYKHHKFMAVMFPGSAVTVAGGINDLGDVAGLYEDGHGFQHGYVMKTPAGCDGDNDDLLARCQPVYTSIDFPGAAQTTGIPFEFGPGLGTGTAGINNRGQVAGLYATAGLYSNGFIYTPPAGYKSVDNPSAAHAPGLGTRLFGINNLQVAVGDYLAQSSPSSAPINYGFLLESGHYTPIFVPGSDKGGFGTQVNGVNDFNIATGIFSDPAHGFHGLIWICGQYFMLDYPAALYTEAHLMNDTGDITGSYTTDPTGATIHGFVAHLKF